MFKKGFRSIRIMENDVARGTTCLGSGPEHYKGAWTHGADERRKKAQQKNIMRGGG